MLIECKDDNHYAELIKTGDHLLYFTAPWCAPCRQLGPILEEVSSENVGVSVLKLDVDQVAVAATYGVRSVPALVVFKGGEVTNTYMGSRSKIQLEDVFKQFE